MNGYVKYLDVAEQLTSVQEGDSLYVASDILELVKICRQNREKFDPQRFIDMLQRKVGKEGTLLFPTFNWDFCQGIPYDYHQTTSRTGALSKAALSRSDFRRTKHPIYSFAVWGKDQALLCDLNNQSSFGVDSPFGYCHDRHAKFLIIGAEVGLAYTYWHYVEEKMGNIVYRYSKNFIGEYIDAYGEKTVRTYSMLVRNLNLDVQYDPYDLGRLIELQGKAQRYTVNGIPYIVVDMNGSFSIIADDILYNKSRMLCSYIGQDE